MKPPQFEKHRWFSSRILGKQVCEQCGLIALNNPATDWCVQKGCNYKDDPAYESRMTQLTKKFDF